MIDKSKFDSKTSSASFFQFIGLWMIWSTLIGLITTAVLATTLTRLTSSDESQIKSLLVVGAEVVFGMILLFLLSRSQRKTLYNKTTREIRHWSLGSVISWAIGMILALIIITPMVIESQQNALAVLGVFGLGLGIIYGIYGGTQSWLLSKHIDYTWMYGIVLIAGVLFWGLFVGDPRKIAIGGLLAPALQGLFSGITMMWLFHLSKLGNIALKTKNAPIQEAS